MKKKNKKKFKKKKKRFFKKKTRKEKIIIKRKKVKNKKIKKKKITKFKKIKKPLDRIRAIKLPKFKIKKIKLYKLKKKNFYKIRKKLKEVTKTNLQGALNFILTPFFRAYDNYLHNKKIKILEKIEFEKKENDKKKKKEERLILEEKHRELRYEEKLARDRSLDLKKFIRQEQAILRSEQAEKRRRFLEEIKLDKKIKSFRKREFEEIKSLEKLALKEQREDYRSVEERLEKIKEKYRLIREQKIRERVESLGVEISDTDTKEDILQKEKEYATHRNTIELVLESFYRSAASLVFQLNKRYIPKHKSILRVIDRRYESNECFIRYDDSSDEDWLILIYLEDSDAKKGKIVVENKANPESHETKSFETKEIFNYSDYLVDAMTSHIDRERKKKNKNQD
tara:strand:+ start:467 stop:1657 length:1191 start_codon:yes stop_codon:yes gene_type:complete